MIPATAIKDTKGERKRGAPALRPATALPTSASEHKTQSPCACGGSCPRCRDKLPIQRKLAISEPGDQFEHEADRVAEIVMRMPDSAVDSRSPSAADPLVQRSVGGGNSGVIEVPPIVHEVLASPGRPLDPETRAFFEPRFGRRFADVRVHTGEKAAESTQAVDALAYTVGADVVFGVGQYVPATVAGRSLIAHELVHVLQQGVMPVPRWGVDGTAGADSVVPHPMTETGDGEGARQPSLTAPFPALQRVVPGLQRRPMFSMRSSTPGYCDPLQQCVALEGWQIAEKMVSKAISVADGLISSAAAATALQAAGDKRGLRTHKRDVRRATASVLKYLPGFTPTELKALRDNLVAISDDMATDVTVHCPTSGSTCKVTRNPAGEVVSYTGASTQCTAGADINVCRDSLMRANRAASTLIHESAHHVVCGIQPPVLRPVPGQPSVFSHETDIYSHEEEFETLTAAQALQNPDSYASFCVEVYTGSTKGFDCHTQAAMDSKAWKAYQAKLALHQIP